MSAEMSRILTDMRFPWVVVLLLALFTAINLIFNPNPFPYSSDSASYIEQARELLTGNAAVETSFGLAGPDKAPSSWFPIGFPIVLYIIGIFGIDPKDGAVYLGRLSAIALPVLVFLCFKNILRAWGAVIVAVLVATTPSVMQHSPNGLTDVFSLALAVIVMAILMNKNNSSSYFIAGLLVAIGYAVRNAHLALLVAVYFWIVLWVGLLKNERKTGLIALAAYSAGLSIILVPLAIRNISIFGGLGAYSMAQSSIGVLENIKAYVAALMFDITSIERMQWSSAGIFLFAIFITFILAASAIKWKRLSVNERRAFTLMVVYVCMGSAMVVAARTKFQWGETINIRHTLQYTPFIIALLLIIMKPSNVMGTQGKKTHALYSGLLLIFIAMHMYYVAHNYPIKYGNSEALRAYNSGKETLCNQSDDVLLVSNWAYVYKIMCGSAVRHIGHVNLDRDPARAKYVGSLDGHATLMAGIDSISARYPNRNIKAAFFSGRHGIEGADLPISPSDKGHLNESGWVITQNNKNGLLISRPVSD